MQTVSPSKGEQLVRTTASPKVEESTREIPWFWAILGLGAFLRLITLGRQSLWLDEAISYWTVNRPFPALLDNLRDASRPLHFLVLHPMVALGGEEWLLRLPSTLAGVASIALIYSIGVELFDRRTGLLSALILAFSPFHIWYSQEARFYALLAFFGLVAVWFAVRALRRNHFVDWMLFGVFEGLTLLTETGGIWFVLAMNVTALLLVRTLSHTGRFYPWGASQAIALLIYLPILPNFLQAVERENTLWIPPATFIQLARTIADFAGSFMRTAIESRLAVLVLFAGFSAGAVHLFREIRQGKGFQLERYILLGSWLAAPVGLSFLLSQRYVSIPFFAFFFDQERSVFLARNLILASFPLYVFLARSLVLARHAWVSIIVAALVLLNAYAYLGNTVQVRKEDYRSAATLIQENVEARGIILFAPPFLETPFAYYYYPVNGLLNVGFERDELEDGVISKNLRDTFTAPIEAVQGEQEVWLVYNENEFQPDNRGTRESLEAWGEPEETWQFEGVIVQRFTRGE